MKNILITGASKGIGRNAALFLGKTFPESRIIVAARDNQKLLELAKEINDHNGKESVIPVAGDLSDLKMANYMQSIVKSEFGSKLDTLILDHASALPFKKIANITDDEYDNDIPKIYATNVFSYMKIATKMIPFLRRKGTNDYGRIVMVTSGGTLPSNWVPSWGPYTFTKANVNIMASFLNLGLITDSPII